MRCNEVLIFKGHVTAPGKVRFVPHTAFDLPDTPADAPPRQSIELRVIAFFDPVDTREKDR